MSSKQAEYHSISKLLKIESLSYDVRPIQGQLLAYNGRMHRLQNVASLCEFGNKQKENL